MTLREQLEECLAIKRKIYYGTLQIGPLTIKLMQAINGLIPLLPEQFSKIRDFLREDLQKYPNGDLEEAHPLKLALLSQRGEGRPPGGYFLRKTSNLVRATFITVDSSVVWNNKKTQ